jgi:hypothetical protein
MHLVPYGILKQKNCENFFFFTVFTAQGAPCGSQRKFPPIREYSTIINNQVGKVGTGIVEKFIGTRNRNLAQWHGSATLVPVPYVFKRL